MEREFTYKQTPSMRMVQWTGLSSGDTGAPFSAPHFPFRSVQVYGEFNGASCIIEGSLDPEVEDATYATLNDAGGTALSLTTAAIKKLREDANSIRPRISGGDERSALTVNLLLIG